MAVTIVQAQQPPCSVDEADDFLSRVGVYNSDDAPVSTVGEYTEYLGIESCYPQTDLFDGLEQLNSSTALDTDAEAHSPQPSVSNHGPMSIIYPWMKRRRHHRTSGINISHRYLI